MIHFFFKAYDLPMLCEFPIKRTRAYRTLSTEVCYICKTYLYV